ncbi:MAG TPA: SDR family oxidoreductase, partial [Candidatus Methylacidiphilales bacterium]
NWATGKQTAFASLGGLPRLQRLNDGKCDPAGRFWVGSLHRKRARHEACLYALESDGRIRLSLGRLSLSNGLAWSCDGRTMFHIDTLERTVTAFDFDTAHGVLGQPRLLARIPASMGSPDGVAIDCENQLWIALWGGGAKGAQACDEIDWQHNLDLNLASHWRLAKLCKPHLEKSGHGVIQIMTSNHAYATLPGCFPYNVTKTALTGLVRSLAVEWGPKVRVVGLAPGFVETPGNDEWFASFPDPAAERAKTIRRHPAGQLGTCEEIGAWSAFLSSNFAVFSTGTVFVIDGGRLALLQDD